MALTVRPVTDADFTTWCDLWDKYLEFYETTRGDAVKEASWARIMDPNSPMFSQLAEVDGVAVGLVNYLFHPIFWEETDLCYLNDLYVNEDARGSGAGAALVQAVVDAAAGAGIDGVYWLTAEDNTRARKLYDRIAEKTPFIHYVIGNA